MKCPLDQLLVTKEKVAQIESTEIIWRNTLVKSHVNLWVAPANGGKTLLATMSARELSQIGYKVYYLQEDAAINDLKEMQEDASLNEYSLVSSVLGDTDTESILRSLSGWSDEGVDLTNYVLIFDTLKKFSEVMNKDRSKRFFNLMRALSVRGATILLLGHTNKNLNHEGKHIFEGVGDNRNDVDELMYIASASSNSDDTLIYTIAVDKVRSFARGSSFSYNKQTRVLTPLDKQVDVISKLHIDRLRSKDSGLIANILQSLKKGEVPVTALCDEVSNAMSVSARKVRDCIKRWGQNGINAEDPLWLERIGQLNNTLYIYTPKAESS